MFAKPVLKLLAHGIKPAAAGAGAVASMTPDEAEASFGGLAAKGSQQIIGQAAQLEARGVERTKIWEQTFQTHGRGAFKGQDGLWRVELEDVLEEVKLFKAGKIGGTLDEVLGRNAIAGAYPNLNRINVVPDQPVGSGNGSYGAVRNPDTGAVDETIRAEAATDRRPFQDGIQRGRTTEAEVDQAIAKSEIEPRKTVLHETQHAVQAREGFSRGSNPEASGGIENYLRSAGEVEARNVETRANMPPVDRYLTPPWQSQDVDEADMIMKVGDGKGINKALARQNAFLATLGLTGVAGVASAGDLDESVLTEDQLIAVQAARDKGISDDKIAAYIKMKAPESDAPQVPYAMDDSPFSPEELDAARRAGFSEEQLAEYARVSADRQQGTLDYAAIRESELPTPADNFMWESELPGPDGNIRKRTLNQDEILRVAAELQVDPRTQEGINAVYSESKRRNFQQTTSSAVATYTELARIESPYKWLKSHFGNNANSEWGRMQQQANTYIMELASERGLELIERDGQYYAKDSNGVEQHVSPGFLQTMGKQKFELAGNIAGFGGGVAMARSLGPYGKLPTFAMGVLGGAIGAVAGNQVDYLSAAIDAQEELNAKVSFEKALGSAQQSVVWEVLGVTAFKLGAFALNGVRNAYRLAKNGNLEGAYSALKENLGYVTDEQIDQMISGWERINQRTAPGKNRMEQALTITPTALPGGDSVIRAVAQRDPAASTAVASEINARAQSLQRAVREQTPEDTGARVLDSLQNYETEVRTNFSVVKNQGAELASPAFRFDMERTAIRPLLESKMSRLEDPATVERMQRLMVKIDTLTESRQFDDLLELRKTVNDYKFNKKINNPGDYDAINEVLGNIDGQIRSAMAESGDDGARWLDDWREANRSYAEYAQTRDNVLWKAIRRPGQSNEKIARTLLNYGPSIDNTYARVMEKLSPRVRADVENSMTSQLVDKFTFGKEGEFRAVQFPELEKAMRPFEFATPEAQRVKEVVSRMSEVYKNDVKLAAVSGNISLPNFQSYLTTDPFARLMYELASKVFNGVKRLIPGREADSLAMVNKVGKFLEDPLNTKTTEQVISAVKDNQELLASINRLQAAAARDVANGVVSTKAKTYRSSRGRLYLTPGRGRETGESVPLHRIVPEESAKAILEVEKIVSSTLTDSAKRKLVDEGFLMIRLEDGQVIPLDRGVR